GFNFIFFFQAEDGIRDGHVTGVQTCALPICNLQSAVVRGSSSIGRRARSLDPRGNTRLCRPWYGLEIDKSGLLCPQGISEPGRYKSVQVATPDWPPAPDSLDRRPKS